MKKLIWASSMVLILFSTVACEKTKNTENADTEDSTKRVVDRDSVATEYEVTETVVEYDTTQRTKTVEANADKNKEKD